MKKLFKERKLFKGGNYMRKYGIYIYKGFSTDVGDGLIQKVTQPCNDWKNHPVLMMQPNLPEHMCAPCNV